MRALVDEALSRGWGDSPEGSRTTWQLLESGRPSSATRRRRTPSGWSGADVQGCRAGSGRTPPPGRAAAPAPARCGSARPRARTRRAPRRGGRAARAGRRGRSAAGGSRAAPARRRARRRARARPPGRRPRETATARLSSTTGDGVELRPARRRARRSAPSRCPRRVRGAGVAGGDRGLQRVGAERRRPVRSARSSAASPRRDQEPVPAAAVLVGQQHRLAVGPDPGAQPRGLDLHQRDQAVHLGLLRRQLGQDAAQPQRLLAQRGAHPVAPRRSPRSPR